MSYLYHQEYNVPTTNILIYSYTDISYSLMHYSIEETDFHVGRVQNVLIAGGSGLNL